MIISISLKKLLNPDPDQGSIESAHLAVSEAYHYKSYEFNSDSYRTDFDKEAKDAVYIGGNKNLRFSAGEDDLLIDLDGFDEPSDIAPQNKKDDDP